LGFNSAQIVSQIDSGDRELKARELAKAAEVLMTSVQNLLTDAPLEVPSVRWRDKPGAGFASVEARLCLRCERYALLEDWCDERIHRDLPRISFSKDRVPKIGEVEWAADEIRIAMELGGRPASSLKAALEEDFGIKVFHDSFVGAALCISGLFGRAILLNRENVRGRRNFSLAHELFHLVVEGIYPQQAQDQEEKHAHIFASSLLLPSASLIALLDAKANNEKIPTRELVATAQDFHVSTSTLLWRLVNLQRMDREKVKPLSQQTASKHLKLARWGKVSLQKICLTVMPGSLTKLIEGGG
jgi:XRE family transcriptional regulator, fatty acid utilization regulator